VKNGLGKIVLVIVLVLRLVVLFEDEDDNEDQQEAEWAFFTRAVNAAPFGGSLERP
jgi:hypothetical protein